MIELKRSDVIFLEDVHQYWLGNTKLSGITSVLGRSVFFKDKFKGIPAGILNKKAEYGSWVHRQFELHDLGLEYEDCWEVREYEKMLKKHKITPAYNEFLVSDGHKYATMVDMVDSNIDLYDHKTSYKLDPEYLSWQLSMNKYLLFLQTGVVAGDLYAVHVKDNAVKRVKIKEKSFEECELMFYTDTYMPSDDEQLPQIEVLDENTVSVLTSLDAVIVELEEKLKKYNEDKSNFLKLAKDNMEKYGVDKWETDKLVLTLSKGYTKTSLDTKKIKEDLPATFEKYSKNN